MKHTEVEFKYSAKNVSLEQFQKFCMELNPKEIVLPAGYDYFYRSPKDPNSFCRHRQGAITNQLTFKRKLADKNNFVRTEHNIDLSSKMSNLQIEAFLKEFGYEKSSSIYKNAFVYLYNKFNFVYYVVYDVAMNELGRFIEIEMDENYDWKDEIEAYTELQQLEKSMAVLGITSHTRLKLSLFEMFGEK